VSTPETAPSASAADATTPEILQLERRLQHMLAAQAATHNTSNERVVGIASVHDSVGDALIVAATRNGHVYSLDTGWDKPKWVELPPVPGTDARLHYDAVASLKAQIDARRAALDG
jgi:hypothetical protein